MCRCLIELFLERWCSYNFDLRKVLFLSPKKPGRDDFTRLVEWFRDGLGVLVQAFFFRAFSTYDGEWWISYRGFRSACHFSLLSISVSDLKANTRNSKLSLKMIRLLQKAKKILFAVETAYSFHPCVPGLNCILNAKNFLMVLWIKNIRNIFGWWIWLRILSN